MLSSSEGHLVSETLCAQRQDSLQDGARKGRCVLSSVLLTHKAVIF